MNNLKTFLVNNLATNGAAPYLYYMKQNKTTEIDALKINGKWYYTKETWKTVNGVATVKCIDGKVVAGEPTSIIMNVKFGK